jgi:hypothetical protein
MAFEKTNAGSLCLVRDADLEVPRANRTEQVLQLRERLGRIRRINGPTRCACELVQLSPIRKG